MDKIKTHHLHDHRNFLGISTLIENLFHTFQDPEESETHEDDNPERLGIEFWLTDYLRGRYIIQCVLLL